MDWNKIKAEYVAGGTSYRKLCAKYGVSRTTLQRKAKDEKWLTLRSQTEAETETKLLKAISEKNAEIDDTYFRLVDKLLKKAEETIDSTPIWSINGLKEMATAMKYLKECKGVKSEADIREQEARIRNLEKQAEADENASTEVTVRFETEGEKSEWAE